MLTSEWSAPVCVFQSCDNRHHHRLRRDYPRQSVIEHQQYSSQIEPKINQGMFLLGMCIGIECEGEGEGEGEGKG